MKRNERSDAILDVLHNQRFASVNELAQRLYISPSSVRRQLIAMEQDGLVSRNYGGVFLKNDTAQSAPFPVRMEKNHHLKRQIAQKAAEEFKDGQTVLLDDSSTAFYLLKHIAAHKNMTVFTNNLYTAIQAVELSIPLYMIGGTSTLQSATMCGGYAWDMLSKIHADLFFFSAASLADNGDISDCNEETGTVRRMMLTRAKRKIFLCDSGKFFGRSAHLICNLKDVDAVYSDVSDDLKQRFENRESIL